jgi:hypothetical protein
LTQLYASLNNYGQDHSELANNYIKQNDIKSNLIESTSYKQEALSLLNNAVKKGLIQEYSTSVHSDLAKRYWKTHPVKMAISIFGKGPILLSQGF